MFFQRIPLRSERAAHRQLALEHGIRDVRAALRDGVSRSPTATSKKRVAIFVSKYDPLLVTT
jgi:formyltetrahydrofolate hydrolase